MNDRYLEGCKPHEPVKPVVVGGNEAGSSRHITGLTLEFKLLPLDRLPLGPQEGAQCSLQHHLCTLFSHTGREGGEGGEGGKGGREGGREEREEGEGGKKGREGRRGGREEREREKRGREMERAKISVYSSCCMMKLLYCMMKLLYCSVCKSYYM